MTHTDPDASKSSAFNMAVMIRMHVPAWLPLFPGTQSVHAVVCVCTNGLCGKAALVLRLQAAIPCIQ